MANIFTVNDAGSKLRRVPFLPRIGLVVEFGGRRFAYKHTPLIETLLNVKDRGFSFKNLIDVASEEIEEIKFPSFRREMAKLRTTVRRAETRIRREKVGPQGAARRRRKSDERSRPSRIKVVQES